MWIKILMGLVLQICVLQSYGQRYLTPVFSGTTVSADITYGAAVNYTGATETLLLDFYEPTGDVLDKRPLIVYLHGGGFIDTNQSKSLVHIVAFCDSMARRGYLAASVDYRLDVAIHNRAVINAMHDARAAVRFFKENAALYGVDTNLIFIAGESAGAVTALTVNYIDKASEVSYPPVAPFASDNSVEGNSGNPGFGSQALATLCLCGGTQTVLGDLLFDTAAIETAVDPPLLQVHGSADFFIPVLSALQIAIRANNVGLPFLYHSLDGAGHCPWFAPLPGYAAYLDTLIGQVTPFLYAFVNNTTTGLETTTDSNIEVNIYPNPSSGLVNILTSSKQPIGQVWVTAQSGETVFRTYISAEQTTIDLTALPAGNYHFRIDSGGNIVETTLVLQ